MSEIRSTRHVIKPEKGVPAMNGEADVVSGGPAPRAVANSKSERFGGSSTGEPARMQPPDSFQVTDDQEQRAFDIDRLEAELNVAISAEMGVPRGDPDVSTTCDAEEIAGASENPVGDAEGDDDSESGNVDSTPAPESLERTVETGSNLVGLLLRPCTAPVERLGSKGRFALNFVAVSMALWTPIVWWGAMTDGFGYLNQSDETGFDQRTVEIDGAAPLSGDPETGTRG